MKITMMASAILATFVGYAAFAQTVTVPNYPSAPMETKYYADGAWAQVTMIDVPGCAQKLVGPVSVPVSCEIYYPTRIGVDLGGNGSVGFLHPIVTWGNGTGAVLPGQYGYWFRHLASWGFVVIRTSDPTALDPQTMLSAVSYLLGENTNASSVFYGKLDPSRIGAAGHSQGAAGAINALTTSNGLIKTAVSFDAPFNSACIEDCINQAALEAASGGSVLYLSGSNDLISPDVQSVPGPLASDTAIYEATPSALVKAKAILVGANHDDVQGEPGCNSVVLLCDNGVYGHLAYPTAWLVWQLEGSNDGPAIFAAGKGEIFSNSQNLQSVLSDVR